MRARRVITPMRRFWRAAAKASRQLGESLRCDRGVISGIGRGRAEEGRRRRRRLYRLLSRFTVTGMTFRAATVD